MMRHLMADLEMAINRKDFAVFAISGPPGVGKSTILRGVGDKLTQEGHYAIHASVRESRDFSEVLSEVTRRLLDVMEHTPELSNLLSVSTGGKLSAILEHQVSGRVQYTTSVLEEISEHLHKNRSLILLLDDLDETDAHYQLANFIKELRARNSGKIQLIVASRSFSFNRFPSLQRIVHVYEIGGFHRDEAEAFITLALPNGLQSRSSLDQLLSMSSVNPLLLTLLTRESDHRPPLSDTVITQTIETLVDSALSSDTDSARALELLAVLEPMQRDEFFELMGDVGEQADVVVERLTQRAFVTFTGPRIELHSIVGEQLRRRLYTATNLDPGALEFGAEEAERDQELFRSLVDMPWVTALFSGKKSIVLGDRGSGKSAIFRLLTDSPEQLPIVFRHDVSVLAEKNPGAFIQRMVTQSTEISSAERFKAIWLTFVAVLVAKRLLMNRAKLSRPLLKDARELVKLGGGRPTLWRRITKIIGGLSVRVNLGPVTVEPSEGGRTWFGSRIDVEAFLTDVEAFLAEEERRIVIVVDRIDEIYKYQRDIQEALIQGLFLAESYLGEFGCIELIMLLRTDLFEIYDIQEKNKFQSRMVTLAWDEKDIILALLKRLHANRTLRTLTDRIGIEIGGKSIHRAAALRLLFPVEVENEDFEPWFLESMKNGRGRISPRQVILFLNAARDYMREHRNGNLVFPIFSPEAVRGAMRRVSELCHDEVVSDFRIATTLVRNCRAGRIMEFTLEDMDRLIDPVEGSNTEQVERLEELGFLCRVVRREDDGLRTTHFVVPQLYTRCWGGEEAVS